MLKLLAAITLIFFLSNSAFCQEKHERRLEEIVVTATRIETPSEDLPFRVHLVDRAKIESQPSYYVSNFGELIRDLPGVNVGQYFPFGPPWVHLRGTGYFMGRTLFLVDGVPVSPFLSTVVNNLDIERVEVLLGPSSALYGPNAMGGVLNVITRRGEKGQGSRIDMGFGSRSTFRPHIEVGDRIGGFHGFVSFTGDYSSGYKMNPVDVVWELFKLGKTGWLSYASLDNNDYRNEHYALKFGWETKRGSSISVAYNFQRLYLDGGRPERIWMDDGEQGVANMRFRLRPSDSFGVTFNIGFQHLNRPGPKENRGAIVSQGNLVGWDSTPTTESLWWQKRYPLELQMDLTYGSNVLTLGGLWLREEEKRETRSRTSGKITGKTYYTTDNTGIFIQNQRSALDEKLKVLLGLRYDSWRYHDIFDLISTPQRPDSIKKEKFTVRAGLNYRFSDNFVVRASGGTGFWPGLPLWFFQNTRTGSTWREANPNLKPEKTWMVDFGADTKFEGTGTNLSATLYYGRIDDVVSYRYDPHPTLSGVNIVRTENLGGARIYGLELSLEQRIAQGLKGFLSLTLNRSRIVDDPEKRGNELRNSPNYSGSLGLIYTNPRLINGRVSLRFCDDRYYDDENTPLPYYHMKPYATLDMKIWRDFELRKNVTLSLSLSGENLTNRRYETEFIWIHPGRSLMGNASLRYIF